MPAAVLDRLSRRPRRVFPTPAPEFPPPAGFEYSKRPSARAARWTRRGWRVGLVLALVLLAVLVGQNIAANRRAAATPSSAGVNADAARAAAGTFAADYLSRDPLAAPADDQDALRAELAPGGDVARLAFAGTGYLVTDAVVPGAVTQLDSTHAAVAVEARVELGAPTSSAAATPAPTTVGPSPSGRPANRPALPAGYAVTATEWLPLSVPVVDQAGTVLVDVAGPVFSADPPPAVSPASDADSSATEATRGWARTLFVSYAAGTSAGAYLSAPGVELAGLAGAVTVTDVPAWSLTSPDPAGVRTGTATVGWTFAPAAELTTSQTYRVTTTTSDNRWYATALGVSAAHS